MPYADVVKQRECQREWARKYREENREKYKRDTLQRVKKHYLLKSEFKRLAKIEL